MLDPNEWTLLRIRRTTKAELERVRASMETAEMMGLLAFDRDRQERIGLDQVVLQLIQFREKHAQRRRRSAGRRKGTDAEPSISQESTDEAGKSETARNSLETG